MRLKERIGAGACLAVAAVAWPAAAQMHTSGGGDGTSYTVTDVLDAIALAKEGGGDWRANLPDPITDEEVLPTTPEKVELGRLLFYDKILSGNMNISCATCHHDQEATGDGLSLPLGEGSFGLGVSRIGQDEKGEPLVEERVPRNAPPVFTLGNVHFDTAFHDGRVAIDPDQPSGFATPAGDDLPLNLDTLLAAQAMFPVTSGTEMAGQPGENAIADLAAAGDLPALWEVLAERLRGIPEYVEMFIAAFEDVDSADDITYAHAANAIAAFEIDAWDFRNSPFDRFLNGDRYALSVEMRRGMQLFYDEAGCYQCHSGPLLSDLDFHAIAMPQIGPGKGQNLPGYDDGHDDLGLAGITGNDEDILKFRTPPLRNVELTAPYGHNGAYDTLEDVVRHHLDPVGSLLTYDFDQPTLPLAGEEIASIDYLVMSDPDRVELIAEANELAPTALSDQEVGSLVAFLRSLPAPDAVDLRRNVPLHVPSGLPVFD